MVRGRLFTGEEVVALIFVSTGEEPERIRQRVALAQTSFPADEPVFVVRGSDPIAGPCVAAYELGLINMEGISEGDERVHAAEKARLGIEAWQKAHPDRVKMPD